jgi:hypothetical protein
MQAFIEQNITAFRQVTPRGEGAGCGAITLGFDRVMNIMAIAPDAAFAIACE